ncbi:MAG: Gfo/Idh/MocA family oxidoreductase [Dehalococcoidia bacterium]
MDLALVGCGGMGLRHTYGIAELWEKFGTFRLAAVCDRHGPAAEHVAFEAERLMGHRPAVFTDLTEMLDRQKDLDALDIVTDTHTHHSFAIQAFEAGLHVMTEKPMGITLKACRQVMEAAEKANRTLAVAGNYRRDPMNRLARALIDAGAIGNPNFLLEITVGGGSSLMHNTGWRALKSRGGSFILEQGVHISDLVLYFMGDIDTVFATTDVFQKLRRRQGMNRNLATFYGHRVEDEFEGQEEIETDAEDTAIGTVRFKSGAAGQITMSNASLGYQVGVSSVHGSHGTLLLPPSRSGRSPEIRLEDREQPITGDDLLPLVPAWELDDMTARFWNDKRRLASYHMDFEEIDRTLIAVELQDFAEAIETSRQPEVDGMVGMKALGLAYALLEPGHAGRAITMDEVLRGQIETYQNEINAEIGV